MDVTTFRAALPSFSDVEKFPSESIAFWITTAGGRLDPLLWGARLEEGLLLLTAHRLEMARRAGGGGNGAGGVIASKSVGPASISYDNSLGQVEGAGEFNGSAWGRQFWQLAKLVGTAGSVMQISAPGYGAGFHGYPYGLRTVL